jgi:hypothetical protein
LPDVILVRSSDILEDKRWISTWNICIGRKLRITKLLQQ